MAFINNQDILYNSYMRKANQNVIEEINKLIDDTICSDYIEEIRFIQEVEEGLRQADEGRLIPHTEVEKSLSKWLI